MLTFEHTESHFSIVMSYDSIGAHHLRKTLTLTFAMICFMACAAAVITHS